MSYLGNPSLDAATLSDRIQEIESLNEKQRPELYQKTGTGSTGQTYTTYVSLKDVSKFGLQYVIGITTNSASKCVLKFYVSWDTSYTPSTSTFIDMTKSLHHIPDGGSAEFVSEVSYSNLTNGDGTYTGAIVDVDNILTTANWLKVSISMEHSETLAINSNGKAI